MENVMYFDTSTVNYFFVLISNLIVFSICGLNILMNYLKMENWFVRNTTHIVLHASLAFIPYFLENLFDLVIALTVIVIVGLIITAIPKARLLIRIVKNSTREDEEEWEMYLNTILTATTLLTILIIFRNNLFVYSSAVLCLSLADGFGEMIGRPFGKLKYHIFTDKTVEGTLAVILGACISLIICALVYEQNLVSNWWRLVIVAIVATILEALNYKFLDNIIMPTGIAITIVLLF